MDILYQFVDTNDSIEFETEPERNFDLFSSFPPTSLLDKKDQLLSEVFDQEKENILIREVWFGCVLIVLMMRFYCTYEWPTNLLRDKKLVKG